MLPAAAARLVCAVLSTARPGRLARQAALRSLSMTQAPPARVAPPAEKVWDGRADLYALSDAELRTLLAEWGQPAFRAKQLSEWLFVKGVSDFDQMLNIPLALREQLRAKARLGSLQLAMSQRSRDGTAKYLWRLADGREIETVMMPYTDGRRTACISSQVGCAMRCSFCATGQMGFSRDLLPSEIFEQALRVSNELRARGERLSNVVLMGMGEPFRNYDAVLDAVGQLRSRLGIGARHITISTVGIAPMIRRFADEDLEVKLAVSLHVADDEARSKLMPVNRKHNLAELLDACRYYNEKTNRRLTFEWALIAGENDSVERATELGRFLRGLKCHVNCIPLNPTAGFGGRAPSVGSSAADAFIDELARHGIPATLRVRRGIDIDAGCGQLANKAAAKAVTL
ncbi:hypothetical protein KFE25_004292 [Diacronema lutheri]|uniref:Radical SAM core domain-containing protein n=2 Tax=Diacronema lutheri TaxID=2081491 RepID=A0A8J5X473_DIALT|nr:hypothetical protein KFE25_004292 [Diacronema lutheri]